MPRFTLTKHPDNQYDAQVTVTFESDMLGVARGHFDDFLKASGFELPLEPEPNEEPDFEFRLTQSDRLVAESDWAWNDAFVSKFGHKADVIDFPTNDDDVPF
jgi:hypothetical protein